MNRTPDLLITNAQTFVEFIDKNITNLNNGTNLAQLSAEKGVKYGND